MRVRRNASRYRELKYRNKRGVESNKSLKLARKEEQSAMEICKDLQNALKSNITASIQREAATYSLKIVEVAIVQKKVVKIET